MRRYLVATVGCDTVIAACAIAGAVILGHLVAGVITEPATRSIGYWRSDLIILAGLWLARALVGWLQGRLGQRGASAVIADLGGQVLRAVTALPPDVGTTRRDDAATVITTGLDGLRPYFTAYLPALFLAAILTPATVAVIALNDVESALIVLVALPLIPVFMVLIGLATAERSAAALEAMTTLQARLMDLIAGIPTLRALGRADGPAERIAKLSAAHRRSAMATLRIAFLSALVLELIATLGVALVAVSIGLRLVFGEMSLAAGLTVLLLAPDVFWPLRRVGVEFHAAQNGKAAADKAFALIEHHPEPPAGTRTITAAGAAIVLDGLCVAGRDGMSPHELSGRLPPGQVTVLTGANGAGKTTALLAIAGLVTPTRGRITIGGVDVAEVDRPAWWRQLAWLAQRPVIIPGTIAENLALFGPLSELDPACRAAGFTEVLDELPNGIDTVVGRGGTGLSLGQRQRLGLARALGSPAPVLLLDEPTSHLDEATEKTVLQAITRRAAEGATVVLVAHRDSVVGIADHVIAVEADHHAAV
ncbi:thiol reductant ABC exporter subunit CydD [Mycobacterium sp. CVI_P3]|uniref:Thiol reductant ABC exporter subunit CydD n=1 Tax=Mycobacterium pinniadriaticum TaxID=2994102 RepID=A0ABT3SBD2_9MYCO|nr:thiol reductant ABC exporter subunit CydD [Mycobacterium pinniadriaticum]MCX2930125.1 thiol reductant ABC exporter subunit CydD [Mycobacterium pinniadriaticum]MCX2936813.1 thiol reductant ABC exporter subunit CydD [Mycobacterium pinniadriaticum]